MLENLFNLIKEEGADSVISNPEIPNEKNDAVLADATNSVADGLQNTLASGGLQDVMSMFGQNQSQTGTGGLLNNPIVSNIINIFKNKLTQNHGIAGDKADGIASDLIPNVISSLVKKTNDPGDSSFDIGSIIGSLTGNNNQTGGTGGFDLGSLVTSFAKGGLDANGDGSIGLNDIISKVTGGARQQQEQAKGNQGGILDTLKGFLK